ncbi:MAG: hydroxyacylglutathione hydrolase [Hydrogenophilus sp.]|nr:hydroxyacylglutathione hydrolase [Hydrogenophilus sp.]
MVEVEAVPILQDNYAWVMYEGEEAVVVDPGEGERLVTWLRERSLVLMAILVTHHHRDHVGGVDVLRRVYGCPVYGPAEEVIPGRTHPLADGERVRLERPRVDLKVLGVPGHTRGHLAYYGQGALFCGDTLFSCGCGRLFEGTAAQMFHSLERLAALPGDTQVYCAHEYTLRNVAFAVEIEPENPNLRRWAEHAAHLRREGRATVPTTIAWERAVNPFLRCGEPAVRAAVERIRGVRGASPLEVFRELRAMRDTFRG